MSITNGVALTIGPEALRPLITEIVREVVAQLATDKATLPDKIYTEAEAAAWLQLREHSLRDERLRGKIQASRIVGRRVRYQQADLLRYLEGRRLEVPK
jgi:hypothetical protein